MRVHGLREEGLQGVTSGLHRPVFYGAPSSSRIPHFCDTFFQTRSILHSIRRDQLPP